MPCKIARAFDIEPSLSKAVEAGEGEGPDQGWVVKWLQVLGDGKNR